MFLIRTLKGIKFGGYSDKTWEGNQPKIDDNAFVFSLDLMKKYSSIQGKKIMNPDKDRGPRFRGWVIWIGQNILSELGETCSKSSALNYFNDFSKDYEINNGEIKFNLNEFEAFQIIMS